MLIYKKTDYMGTVETVAFETRQLNADKIQYFFNINYQGDDWLFIDTVKFRTNSGVETLTTKSYKREVQKNSKVQTVETVYFRLDSAQISNINQSNEFAFQYGRDIITFNGEDLQKIKDFLSQD